MLLSSVSYHGPWQSSLSAWTQQSENKQSKNYKKHLLSYHHNPDKKERVTNQNEENWNLTNKEINSVCLKERTILDNIFTTAWIIKYNTQQNPYCHVHYWASCQEEVLENKKNLTRNLPQPKMRKCLNLMETRERGNCTWRNKYNPKRADSRVF